MVRIFVTALFFVIFVVIMILITLSKIKILNIKSLIQDLDYYLNYFHIHIVPPLHSKIM